MLCSKRSDLRDVDSSISLCTLFGCVTSLRKFTGVQYVVLSVVRGSASPMCLLRSLTRTFTQGVDFEVVDVIVTVNRHVSLSKTNQPSGAGSCQAIKDADGCCWQNPSGGKRRDLRRLVEVSVELLGRTRMSLCVDLKGDSAIPASV